MASATHQHPRTVVVEVHVARAAAKAAVADAVAAPAIRSRPLGESSFRIEPWALSIRS